MMDNANGQWSIHCGIQDIELEQHTYGTSRFLAYISYSEIS
jgi:hypothetical protein